MENAYQIVTDKIVAMLDENIIPWKRPWACQNKISFSHYSGKPYSILNCILLQDRPGEYATFTDVKREGGNIIKGAKAQRIIFGRWYIPKAVLAEAKKNGVPEKDLDKVYALKYFNVFHIDDVDGVEPKVKIPKFELNEDAKPIDVAESVIEQYIKRVGLKVERTDLSNEAYYCPTTTDDYVRVPKMEQFENIYEYYSVIFHELVHSTGHSSRLNRFDGSDSSIFGSESYSEEELVAEIGAAFLLGHCGIEQPETLENSVAYIQNWRKRITNKCNLIIRASSRAEKAVNYILGIEKKQEEETN